jgi:hypothetical protein
LTIDIICKHSKNESFDNINSEKSKNLFKIIEAPSSEFKFPRPILTLSIGSRVQVIENLATEIGY